MKSEKLYVIHVTVIGYGPFPIDMLRYDRSCPDHETDSYDIARTTYEPQMREVHLVQFSKNQKISDHSIARWKSFKWKIMKAECDGKLIYLDS